MGSSALLVEQVAQGTPSRYLQRARRDVTTKPFFREPFKKKRCLMPVSGYYEWQDTSDGKQPWYFTARDGSPVLTIAGLWDEWKNRQTGNRLRSCAMIITEQRFDLDRCREAGGVVEKFPSFAGGAFGSTGRARTGCCSLNVRFAQ
jgi:putative SOS response-associated peptidase YedK